MKQLPYEPLHNTVPLSVTRSQSYCILQFVSLLFINTHLLLAAGKGCASTDTFLTIKAFVAIALVNKFSY